MLKGIMEHDDPSSYFDSTTGLRAWADEATRRGWVEVVLWPFNVQATPAGKAHYESSGLGDLPRTRHTLAGSWDWSGYVGEVTADALKLVRGG